MTDCLIAELVAAINDLGGLDQLPVHRLGGIASLASVVPSTADLSTQCKALWEMHRPPTADDLEDLDGLELIWSDDLAELDAGAWIDWGIEDDDPTAQWAPVDDFNGNDPDEIMTHIAMFKAVA